MTQDYTICIIKDNLSSQDFLSLLNLSLKFTQKVSLVVRDELGVSSKCMQFLSSINDHFLASKKVSEWPGTKLLNTMATQYIYRNSRDLLGKISKNISNYSDFIQPNFPEDIAFLRENNIPWFVSISHEKECLFNINQSEKEALELLWPGRVICRN